MTKTSQEVAAELADFYRTGAAPVHPSHETAVKGGLYDASETQAAATHLNAEILPGSWRDYEMRGVPTIQWPEHVMAEFIEDQSKPQPSIFDDPRLRQVSPPKENIVMTSNDVPTMVSPADYVAVINQLCRDVFQGNVDAGWWTDIKTGETLVGKDAYGRDRRNVGELLCLVHSEVSEAMEGYRKSLMDDKLPHRTMLEVELADTIIRICDIAGAHNLDLGGAIAEKRKYNASRADHKIENRLSDNGKLF